MNVKPLASGPDDKVKGAEEQCVKSVAIIGAGYAGLTLAACLTRKNSTIHATIGASDDAASDIKVTIYDKLQPPRDGVLFGKIRVPAAVDLFRIMGWKWGQNEAEHDEYIEEEILLSKLRQAVHPFLRYHCYVGWIESNNYLAMYDRKSDKISKEGPFDCIVIANGVRSNLKRSTPKHASQHSRSNSYYLLSIGDASVTAFDLLGLERLRTGANRSILQGIALASELQKSTPDVTPFRFAFARSRNNIYWIRALAVLLISVLIASLGISRD